MRLMTSCFLLSVAPAPTGKRPRGRPRTRWCDYISVSDLAWVSSWCGARKPLIVTIIKVCWKRRHISSAPRVDDPATFERKASVKKNACSTSYARCFSTSAFPDQGARFMLFVLLWRNVSLRSPNCWNFLYKRIMNKRIPHCKSKLATMRYSALSSTEELMTYFTKNATKFKCTTLVRTAVESIDAENKIKQRKCFNGITSKLLNSFEVEIKHLAWSLLARANSPAAAKCFVKLYLNLWRGETRLDNWPNVLFFSSCQQPVKIIPWFR